MRYNSMVLLHRTVKNKHVLVTGGAGFIGSHLVDHLIAEGVGQLTVVDNLFLGTHANLAKAYRQMPGIRLLSLDASNNSAIDEAFSHLGNVDVVFDLAVIP